jgi:hypothetical protein
MLVYELVASMVAFEATALEMVHVRSLWDHLRALVEENTRIDFWELCYKVTESKAS